MGRCVVLICENLRCFKSMSAYASAEVFQRSGKWLEATGSGIVASNRGFECVYSLRATRHVWPVLFYIYILSILSTCRPRQSVTLYTFMTYQEYLCVVVVPFYWRNVVTGTHIYK